MIFPEDRQQTEILLILLNPFRSTLYQMLLFQCLIVSEKMPNVPFKYSQMQIKL